MFLESRLLVASALKPLIDEPLPEALLASVRRMADEAQGRQSEGSNVVPLRPRQQQVKRWAEHRWVMPLAAGIVLVITGVVGFTVGRSLNPSAMNSSAQVAEVLDREASGRDIALRVRRDTAYHRHLSRQKRLSLPRIRIEATVGQ
ncbi:hypothetical protein LZK73_29345 (plasmid) [Neorhizobium galegae]|nr:hypothetical protein LZK73_29345 [Neorhizobium galegae]